MAEVLQFNETIERRRTTDLRLAIWKRDRSAGITLAATDQVRAKLGRIGVVPLLDLNSEEVTANGSTVTIEQRAAPAEVVVRFAQDDVAGLDLGYYRLEIAVVDDSETAPADAIKHAGHGEVQVVDTMLGAVALVP